MNKNDYKELLLRTKGHSHTSLQVHTLFTTNRLVSFTRNTSVCPTYRTLPPNCTFFVAAVASVFPEGQKNEKRHKSKKRT